MERYSMYGGKIILCFDPIKHKYTVKDKPVDGCTTVLKIINKPALMYWAVNQACDYIDKNLEVGVPVCEVEKKKLIDGAKKAHRKTLRNAGDLGTMLHELIEKKIKGLPYKEPVNEILKRSFGQFNQWVEANDIEFKLSEKKVYSKKHRYAGTLDFTCDVNGVSMMGDLKTSSGIWPEYSLQIAAYQYALQEEYPKIEINGGIIIRCGKDGVFEVKEVKNYKRNLRAFLSALNLHRTMKVLGKEKT